MSPQRAVGILGLNSLNKAIDKSELLKNYELRGVKSKTITLVDVH